MERVLSPDALTIGFARRFATYKRANLILRDLERLALMVNDPKRPVQFVFAGKAHPHDQPGKQVLQQIAELVKDELNDVGISMAIQLIEFATVIQNGNTGDYQALSLGWSGDVDPDGDLYSLLYTKAGFNFARYSNPEFDKLLDAGRANLLRELPRVGPYKFGNRQAFDDGGKVAQPVVLG